MPIAIEDKKDLQSRLMRYAYDTDERFPVMLTHIEAKYVADLINEDWRR